MNTLNQLLRDKPLLFRTVLEGKPPLTTLALLCIYSILGIAGFGAALNVFAPDISFSLHSAWKLAVVFWGTVVLCTPSLLVFSALHGSRMSTLRMITVLTVALATSGIVLLALLPISWFFAWTDTTHTSAVVQFINTLCVLIAAGFGWSTLRSGITTYHQDIDTSAPHNTVRTVLLVWSILVIIVGVQMTTKLSPWYEIKNPQRICERNLFGETICFQHEGYGSLTTALIVDTTTARWTPHTNPATAEENHLFTYARLGDNGHETSLTPSCTQTQAGYTCALDLADVYTSLEHGATYIFQIDGNADMNHEEYRDSILYTHP